MQIVVFKLGDEHFAVEAEKVQGINDMMSMTLVSKAPNYIKGLINLRGSIKLLVDINLLLNVNTSDNQENIIILNVGDEEIGVCVDEVEEVLDINESSIQILEEEVEYPYIKGIYKHDEKLLTIIDIDKLLKYKK